MCDSGAIFARKFVNPMEKKLLTQLPTSCRKKSVKRSRKKSKKRSRKK